MEKPTENRHELYMRRCFDLARLGAGRVSPNPMVGAVIVHAGRIIGEGRHEVYGTAHAEVNAVNSVAETDRKLLPESTIYVSLEPCCIFGKTPPCTNLILENKIPEVVISCLDATPEVAGNGVQILRDAGVKVTTGILEKEGRDLARFRNTFAGKNRPYILLKFAQSADGFMGKEGEQIWLTNAYSKRKVHKMRAETDAILVGTNTAATDNPQLNSRYWSGRPPLRLVIDRTLRLPQTLNLFDDSQPTLVFTEKDISTEGFERTRFITLDFSENVPRQIAETLAGGNVTSLIVEGGAQTLQSFIDAGLWDEAHIFTVKKRLNDGIAAPKISGEVKNREEIAGDELTVLLNAEAGLASVNS